MSTIVIVGANRGIGLSLVKTYIAQGQTVLALCRQSSTELEELKVEVITGVDVTSADSMKMLTRALAGRSIDLLIHNSGILGRDRWPDLDFDGMRAQFEVNTLGPLRVVQALQGQLAPHGKIAIVTSRMGSIDDNTSGGAYGYRMSKCAVNMAAKSLSIDLSEQGHAVGVFHPGYVKTDMTQGRGYISPDEAAGMLVTQFSRLSMETTGLFFHANGDALPW